MKINRQPGEKLLAALATLAALYSTTAEGACTSSTAANIIDIPDMAVPRDTPIGAEIGTAAIKPSITSFDCTKGFTFQEFFVQGYGANASSIEDKRIYKLGPTSSGIGYAVYGQPLSACQGSGFVPIPSSKNDRRMCAVNGSFANQPMRAGLKLVFYKIGTITPGRVPTQQVASFALRNNQNSWVYPEVSVRSSDFTVSSLGCQVNQPEIQVPLGKALTSELEDVGSTAAKRTFSIALNCDVGTKVKLTLSAGHSGVYNNVNGLLNLTDPNAAGTAQAVKVQILNNGTPVTFDKLMHIGTQDSSGTFDIPLTAQYYRSAGTLKAGTANSSATYTISYE